MKLKKIIKKNKKTFIISGIILASTFLFLVIYFFGGFGKTLSFINDVDPEKVYISVISEDSQQQTIKYTASGGRITDFHNAGSYNLNEPEPIARRGGDMNLPGYSASDYNYGYLIYKDYYSTTATTTNVQIIGLPAGATTQNLSAVCKITPIGIFNQMQCTFYGIITVQSGGIFEGITLIATPTFYKAGYEPTQTFYRLENNFCSSVIIKQSEKTVNDYSTISECQSNIITEQPRVYYRLTENQCTSINILPSQKTGNDYPTLDECQIYIIEPPTNESLLIPILIITGSLVFIILLIIVYIKTRRRI